MNIYRGGRRQRGYGMGGIFSGFFRKVLPFLQDSAMTVGRNLLNVGSNVLEDMETGDKDIVGSLKRHGKAGAISAAKKIGGHAFKRARDVFDDTPSSESKRRRRTEPPSFLDIFS